jgi:hypothetical protein
MWFGEDVTRAVFPGLMVDVSSGGMAFTCQARHCPIQAGQPITVRFSLPRFDESDPTATIGITRTGFVRWMVAVGNGTHKVGIQFDIPLSLKPAEQAALAGVFPHTTP